MGGGAGVGFVAKESNFPDWGINSVATNEFNRNKNESARKR